ncbi:MAG: DUF2786 domain-containing protein [Chlamydiia bacterium]|nr:DUF2786 domain-containing protein [Chlamydiia bacterium]
MEILYSTTILAFLKKVKRLAREILREEMGIPVGHSRFSYQGYSYPLHFVVFDHPSQLGFFQTDLFEIGVNKAFLLEAPETIKDILRHELAHLIVFLKYGAGVPSHGKAFREVCQSYGWSSEVSRSIAPMESTLKNHRIVEKVRKLLSLAESSHPHEAEEATLKAQHLLDKYNITYTPEEEETVLMRVLEKKRGNTKLQAIASILKSFYVYPVLNRGKTGVYLEIIGERLATQIAEYVAHFLDHQFEALWREAQQEDSHLKGMASKNSFFRGLAEGFQRKHVPSSALMRIEKNLVILAQKIYPHLSSRSASFRHHEKGARKGREKGKNLSIREGISKRFPPFLLARKC